MLKLLLVDDEILTRTVLKKVIEESFSLQEIEVVGAAKNGIEALQLVYSFCPDIVLMDVKLPGSSGLEITSEIKKTYPHIKIIIISAYNEFDFAHKAIKLGAFDYILKPCLPDNLIPVLKNAISDIKKEQERDQKEEALKKQLDEMMPYIKMSLGFDLLMAKENLENDLKSRLEFVGGKKLPSVIMVADIDNFYQITRESLEVEKQHIKKRVYQAISEALKGTDSFALPLSKDEIAIFVVDEKSFPGSVKDRAINLAEKIRGFVEEKTSVTITIGIGNYYNSSNLYLSHQEASEASQLGSFFIGSNSVIHIDYLEALKSNQYEYPIDLEPALIGNIKTGSRDEAIKIGRDLVNNIFTYNDLQYLKYYLNSFLTVLTRAITGTQKCSRDLTEQNMLFLRKLVRVKKSDDAFDWLDEVVRYYINYLFKCNNSMASDAISRVLDFVDNNYHKEISLTGISSIFYINPVYFCRIFKYKMGVTFIEHLTKIRLEKAKEKLSFTDLDIKAIAEEVGFKNSNYFSRVFKKHENLTPSEFRSMVRN